MNRIVILSCGQKKVTKPTEAYRLYQGSYYKMNLKYALSITSLNCIYILSAKYGLIKSTEIIAPYNLKMGEPGSVTTDKIKQQAASLGILQNEVIILGGSLYVNKIREVFMKNKAPILGKSMGYAMQLLSRNMGKLPP